MSAEHMGAHIDYLCVGCHAYCGGILANGPAFVVSRETMDESETDDTFAVLCRDCWNKAIRGVLRDDYLEEVAS